VLPSPRRSSESRVTKRKTPSDGVCHMNIDIVEGQLAKRKK
jgi:hypothetical protein